MRGNRCLPNLSTDPSLRYARPIHPAASKQTQMTAVKNGLFILLVALCVPRR